MDVKSVHWGLIVPGEEKYEHGRGVLNGQAHLTG